MRPLVLQMQISVDRFVAGPNGELDWIFKAFDDRANAWIVEHAWRAGLHIMGSRSFQDMASFWPSSTEPRPDRPRRRVPPARASRRPRSRPAAVRRRPQTLAPHARHSTPFPGGIVALVYRTGSAHA